MKRFWEVIISARGSERIYCAPFLFLFRIITPFYQMVSRWHLRRRARRKSKEWRAPLISIGSVAVGGSGKTPIVLWLAEYFLSRGRKTAVVHSGYGRGTSKEFVLEPGSQDDLTAKQIGDEPVMMRRQLPTAYFAIGQDKKKMIAHADREYAPDVIILDDGFQRLDIAKELDVAVLDDSQLASHVDSSAPLSRKHLFPGGVLREKIGSLRRADVIFAIRAIGEREPSPAWERVVSGTQIMTWRLSLSHAVSGDRKVSLEELRLKKLFLFAGIGSYSRLLRMISGTGINLCGEHNFGDHYTYDPSDIAHITALARKAGADGYLTTAKDAVKLDECQFDPPLYILELSLTPDNPAAVDKLFASLLP